MTSDIDRLITVFDSALRTLFGPAPRPDRISPAASLKESNLSSEESRLSGQLLRVDHAGEVCAQALYQGQALTAERAEVVTAMKRAADEENDHLAWTAERLNQLGTHTSYLNPVWYAGSFALGAMAGLIGDKWSLGFVAETEKQVVKHLDDHLQSLPKNDQKSRAILEQMRTDEGQHATTAIESGAAALPQPVRDVMAVTAKIMTKTALYV